VNENPRVVFLGSGEIGLPALKWLGRNDLVGLVGVVTQPDKPVGRSQTLTAPAPKQIARELGLPVLQPPKVRRPEALAEIAELRPDFVVVMAYGQILPQSLLELPRIACLNLHASLLPAHRGAAPIPASILAGDRKTGITVMYMAEGLDTGDILLTRALLIRRRETGGSLHDRLAELAPAALADALRLLLEGKAPRMPQDSSRSSYAGKLDRDTGRINWNESSTQLDRLVRAFNPWPSAYTTLMASDGRSRRLKIFRALPVRRFTGSPGQVVALLSRGPVVGTGAGGLLLLEVQLEGKRRLPADEFLRGTQLSVGSILGGGD
jgi:methionyl-tRNA formyltransferase